jgi:hypothetical protein
VIKNSASYFLGDSNNDSLQRIYGISFPDKKQLADYKVFLAEAAKRDHRKIGKEQELFFFNDMSPGSCFFLPHGTRIYNSLVELMRVSLLTNSNAVTNSATHIVGILQTRLPRSHLAEHVPLEAVGDLRALAELQRRHVRPGHREREMGAEADELPRALLDL